MQITLLLPFTLPIIYPFHHLYLYSYLTVTLPFTVTNPLPHRPRLLPSPVHYLTPLPVPSLTVKYPLPDRHPSLTSPSSTPYLTVTRPLPDRYPQQMTHYCRWSIQGRSRLWHSPALGTPHWHRPHSSGYRKWFPIVLHGTLPRVLPVALVLQRDEPTGGQL